MVQYPLIVIRDADHRPTIVDAVGKVVGTFDSIDFAEDVVEVMNKYDNEEVFTEQDVEDDPEAIVELVVSNIHADCLEDILADYGFVKEDK